MANPIESTACEPYRKALEQFVRTVEATGGVIRSESGCYEPLGDPEWIDIGDAYVEACAVLGREVLLIEDRQTAEQ
jgi:hypothetical protein